MMTMMRLTRKPASQPALRIAQSHFGRDIVVVVVAAFTFMIFHVASIEVVCLNLLLLFNPHYIIKASE